MQWPPEAWGMTAEEKKERFGIELHEIEVDDIVVVEKEYTTFK